MRGGSKLGSQRDCISSMSTSKTILQRLSISARCTRVLTKEIQCGERLFSTSADTSKIINLVDKDLKKARDQFQGGELKNCVETNERILDLFKDNPLMAVGQWQKVAATNMNTAVALKLMGDYPRAIKYAEEGLKHLDKHFSDHKPQVCNALDLLGELCEGADELEQAHKYVERSIQVKTVIHGPDSPLLALSLNVQGALFLKEHALPQAHTAFMRALAMNLKAHGGQKERPVHPNVAVTMSNLAGVLRAENRLEECTEIYQEVIASFESYGKQVGADGRASNLEWMQGQAWSDLGATYVRLGKGEEARKALEKALVQFMASRGLEHPATQSCIEWMKQAKVLIAEGGEKPEKESAKTEVPEFGSAEKEFVSTLLDETEGILKKEEEGMSGQIIFFDRRGHVGFGHPQSKLF